MSLYEEEMSIQKSCPHDFLAMSTVDRSLEWLVSLVDLQCILRKTFKFLGETAMFPNLGALLNNNTTTRVI